MINIYEKCAVLENDSFILRLVEEKDAVIEILREELNRKNKQIL